MTTGSAHADIFFMTTTAAPDAVSFAVSGTAVYGDHITVRIGSASGLHEIAVHETGGGTPLGAYTVTPSVPATTAVIPLSPVPHSTSLTITITALGSTPGALDTITFYLPRDTTVPTNIASNVCTGGGYRYGYNGQMKDNEWAGEGNHLDFKFRGYDPRIGRFYSVDPLTKKFPWYTPYQFAGNKSIWAIDLDGLEEFYAQDGSLLGKYGTSTEIRVVYKDEVGYVEAMFNLQNSNPTADLSVPFSMATKYSSAPVNSNPDNLAHQWGESINGTSIVSRTEFSSTIFSTIINGQEVYSYTKPMSGGYGSTGSENVPNGYAGIHSHGGYASEEDERFSTFKDSKYGGDVGVLKSMGLRYGYLATPLGNLKKYDMSTNETTTLSSDLERDPKAKVREREIRNPTPDKNYFNSTSPSIEKNNALKRIQKWEHTNKK